MSLQGGYDLGSYDRGGSVPQPTRDVRASSFLFQRISVVVQRFNLVLLHDGFVGLGSLPNKFRNFLL